MNATEGDIVKDQWGNIGVIIGIFSSFKLIPRELRKYTLLYTMEPIKQTMLSSPWIYIEYIDRKKSIHPISTVKYVKLFGILDLY